VTPILEAWEMPMYKILQAGKHMPEMSAINRYYENLDPLDHLLNMGDDANVLRHPRCLVGRLPLGVPVFPLRTG
jgi:hypothetical protein